MPQNTAKNRRWTTGDIDFLKDNYSKYTNEEIGQKLNRSKLSVNTRASLLGLKKFTDYEPLRDEIKLMAGADYTVPEIAEQLELNYHTLWQYIRKNHIAVVSGAGDSNKRALAGGFEEEPLAHVDFNQITFSEWFKRWYNTYRKSDIKEVTKRKYRGVYTHINDHFIGTKRLIELTREDVQNHVNWYGADRSKQTVLDHMQLIRSSFKDAVLDGHINQNPASNVKPIFKEQKLSVVELKELREKKKWLEAEEYQKFKYYLVFTLQQTLKEKPSVSVNGITQNARQILNTMVFIALKTGARTAEVMGLTRDDVLYDSMEINIDKTWDYKRYESGNFSPTKNTASIRTIVVDKETIDLLKKYTDWLEEQELETELNTLFILQGSNIYIDTLNRHLNKVFLELDIEPITMHKLRHTQASYLIAKGVPLQVIAKRLGHTDTNMIQRVYGHLLKETEQLGNKMILELI